MSHTNLDDVTTPNPSAPTRTMDESSMPVIINQSDHTVPIGWCLQTLVESYLCSLAGCSAPFAIILNQRFVPKAEWANCKLSAGDRIDTLSPVQGG